MTINMYDHVDIVLGKGKEGVEQLATALEVQQQIENQENGRLLKFYWDFSEVFVDITVSDIFKSPTCGYVGCAIGLAHMLWPKQVTESEAAQIVKALGFFPADGNIYMATDTAMPQYKHIRRLYDTFGVGNDELALLYDTPSYEDVTAGMVAERLRLDIKAGVYDNVAIC